MKFPAKQKAFFIAALVCLALSLIVMGLRIYVVYSMVDPATGFFTKAADWVNVAAFAYAILMILFFLFALIYGFRFCTKEEKKIPDMPSFESAKPLTKGTALVFSRASTPRVFISTFCGFSLITFSLLALIDLELTTWETWLHILSILAGTYFLLQYTPLLPLYSKRRTLASLLPVFWSGFHMVSHFLSASRIASGEYHNWQMVMLCLIALFFYLQALFTTPARRMYHFNLLYAVGIVGAGLIFIFAIPTLLLSSFWNYSAFWQFTNHYALMTLIAVALYMLVFLFGILRNLADVECEEDLLDKNQNEEAKESPVAEAKTDL